MKRRVCTIGILSAGLDWTPGWAMEALRSWQELLPLLVPRLVQSRHLIFEQGARLENLYLLRTGIVKLAMILADGTEALLSLRFPGEVLEWPSFDQPKQTFHAFAITLVDSELLHMPLPAFESQLARRELCTFVANNLVRDLLLRDVSLSEMRCISPVRRLKHLVDQLAVVDLHNPFSLPARRFLLTDEEMAQVVGVSARHVRRLRHCIGTSL